MHWGLRAPAHALWPVHAKARIAKTEAESIRSQKDADALETPINAQENAGKVLDSVVPRRKDIASPEQTRDVFDAVNTVRFPQPTLLQYKFRGFTTELQRNSKISKY